MEDNINIFYFYVQIIEETTIGCLTAVPTINLYFMPTVQFLDSPNTCKTDNQYRSSSVYLFKNVAFGEISRI